MNRGDNYLLLERIMVCMHKKEFSTVNGDLLKIPPKINCFFELESLENLSPSCTTNFKLVFLTKNIFDPEEEF